MNPSGGLFDSFNTSLCLNLLPYPQSLSEDIQGHTDTFRHVSRHAQLHELCPSIATEDLLSDL